MESLNDTMGPEGLIPSLLVFGTVPIPAMQLQRSRSGNTSWFYLNCTRVNGNDNIVTTHHGRPQIKASPASKFDFKIRQMVRV